MFKICIMSIWYVMINNVWKLQVSRIIIFEIKTKQEKSISWITNPVVRKNFREIAKIAKLPTVWNFFVWALWNFHKNCCCRQTKNFKKILLMTLIPIDSTYSILSKSREIVLDYYMPAKSSRTSELRHRNNNMWHRTPFPL